jgi:5'-nucleotidase
MANEQPRILLTNDDGIRAPGLQALAEEIGRLCPDLVVVAPDREMSAASHAMTIRHPLRIAEHAPNWFAVEGTPTDCVNLAFFHVLGERPDLVLSGINAGYNLGEDVTYSGTVAGALEGRILGAPSIAVSAASDADADTLAAAARVARELAEMVIERGLPADSFLNVNVPPQARGFRVTRQGKRAFREGLVSRKDPKGKEYYWIGLAPARWQDDPNADHAAVEQGLVSVTPLHSDLTYYRGIATIEGWGLGEDREP